MSKRKATEKVDLGDYRFGFAMPERSVNRTKLGLSAEIVFEISGIKKNHMDAEIPLESYERFISLHCHPGEPIFSPIDFDAITLLSPGDRHAVQDLGRTPP